jgi:PASTA domain-containing protein
VSLGPEPVRVPDVVGATRSEAEIGIIAAGLRVGATTGENSDTIAAGRVISQDPSGGTEAEEGSSVSLVISLGPGGEGEGEGEGEGPAPGSGGCASDGQNSSEPTAFLLTFAALLLLLSAAKRNVPNDGTHHEGR